MSFHIDSFSGGLSFDKNTGQKGAFWNSKNIDFRRNTNYIELSKGVTTLFSTQYAPRSITLWGTGGSITTDIVVFTGNGIYTNAGQQSTLANIVNTAEANGKKYIICSSSLREYTNPSTNTLVTNFTTSQDVRPVLNFYGDLIIGDGSNILRYNKDGTLQEAPIGAGDLILAGLDGIVYAITNIGNNIFVWCNNGTNTTIYVWDGLTNRPSQIIPVKDKPVRNVAENGGLHYWWSAKSNSSIREFLIGESYKPQIYGISEFPKIPLSSNSSDDRNRLAITSGNDDSYINSIETIRDVVFLPGVGCIYGFGKYYPSQPYAIAKEFTFTGTNVTAMCSGGITGSGFDAGGFLVFSVLNGASHDVNVINFGQDSSTPSAKYMLNGTIESMEYEAQTFYDKQILYNEEENKKLIVPFYLPNSSCSVKVYIKKDRASSYTLIKTINTTDYGVGYNTAEITGAGYDGPWKRCQIMLELITTDSAYSPQVFTDIFNLSNPVGRL